MYLVRCKHKHTRFMFHTKYEKHKSPISLLLYYIIYYRERGDLAHFLACLTRYNQRLRKTQSVCEKRNRFAKNAIMITMTQTPVLSLRKTQSVCEKRNLLAKNAIVIAKTQSCLYFKKTVNS